MLTVKLLFVRQIFIRPIRIYFQNVLFGGSLFVTDIAHSKGELSLAERFTECKVNYKCRSPASLMLLAVAKKQHDTFKRKPA